MELGHLNPTQKEAVLETDGPVMILAGAGSGKTRTLVSRIQYLLDDKMVSPYHLLAVTFSNKAAREMRERIAQGSDVDLGALQITTFHSFCARVLRNEANYLGLSRNFTIYDTSESKSVIKAILGKRGISLKEISPAQVQYFIDDLKNNGHYVNAKADELLDEIETDDVFYDYFLEYEAELHKSNAVDFGGLITGVLNLFDNFPEVLQRYQKRFKYLLVDEYQDTNRSQFKLIKMLSENNRNICVVGDEDQSIYSWRGADIRNILDFEKIFPEARLIKLEQNYRSSKNIIDAATHVISQNEMRKGKDMWTENDRGESIDIIECQDDRAEAEFVANKIQEMTRDEGVDPHDIAVFYRTNAQSRIIEDALRQRKIPYRVVAGIKFYERKEVKDLLAYVRLVVNDKDSLALSRIINVPVRGIGPRTLRKIEDEALKLEISLWEMLEKIVSDLDEYKYLRLSSKVKSSLQNFVGLIQEVKLLDSNGELPSHCYEKLLMESGYYETLVAEKSYESQARIENLEELLSAIKQFEETNEGATLLGFLETVTLDQQGTEEEPEHEVSMMTIHGAKGLEYLYVFVVGAEETVFPSYQSMENGDEAIEEERRLFYVAMTRAMTKLYILFAQGRMLWGSLKFNGPSRFIDEIPDNFFEWKFYKKGNLSQGKKTNGKADSFDEFSQVPEYEANETVEYVSSVAKPSVTSKYPEGSKVKHKLYGIGSVLESEGSGPDEKIVIMFNDGTRKKFMVKFAPIERV
jgi:DNA helicase-2/ATP-dependent DNA helicase PcrA